MRDFRLKINETVDAIKVAKMKDLVALCDDNKSMLTNTRHIFLHYAQEVFGEEYNDLMWTILFEADDHVDLVKERLS